MLKQRELNASDTMGCGGKTYSKPSGHTEGDTIPGQTTRLLTRLFINSRYLTLSNPVFINKTTINRDLLSTWLIVGKLVYGMRCCK